MVYPCVILNFKDIKKLLTIYLGYSSFIIWGMGNIQKGGLK